MQPFLDEVDRALELGLWLMALLSTLTIPDACGAVDDPGPGKAGARYETWYNGYAKQMVRPNWRFDGAVVWKLRNGMMHETSLQLRNYGYDRVIFSVPSAGSMPMHYCLSRNNGGGEETAFIVMLDVFCREVLRGASRWLHEVQSDAASTRRDRLNGLIQMRPAGLAPHVVGCPMVS